MGVTILDTVTTYSTAYVQTRVSSSSWLTQHQVASASQTRPYQGWITTWHLDNSWMCHLLLDFKFSQVILPRILGKTLLDPPQTGGLSPAQYNYTTRTPEDMHVGLHLVYHTRLIIWPELWPQRTRVHLCFGLWLDLCILDCMFYWAPANVTSLSSLLADRLFSRLCML